MKLLGSFLTEGCPSQEVWAFSSSSLSFLPKPQCDSWNLHSHLETGRSLRTQGGEQGRRRPGYLVAIKTYPKSLQLFRFLHERKETSHLFEFMGNSELIPVLKDREHCILK